MRPTPLLIHHVLCALAGLFHDLGKSIEAFLTRLFHQTKTQNLIRHEWVSLRLLEAFVGNDDDATWLARLANPTAEDDATWLGRLSRDYVDEGVASPFHTMRHAPLAQALGWLILTHHRLPVLPPGEEFRLRDMQGVLERLLPAWNEPAALNAEREAFTPYWTFPHGLPVTGDAWRSSASAAAASLARWHAAQPAETIHTQVLNNPYFMHVCRLAHMLADHSYSRLNGDHPDRIRTDGNCALIANTHEGQPNQTLDEHLLGVAAYAHDLAGLLPQLRDHLPHLHGQSSLTAQPTDARYLWQQQAADMAARMRDGSAQGGAFIVNMASTGCGKTLANARIMYELAAPGRGMRCSFATGLRTLTLQTGKALRDRLGLTDQDVAILVGNASESQNGDQAARAAAQAEQHGSESIQDPVDDEAVVDFAGQSTAPQALRRAITGTKMNKLLLAPLLACTIDHLTPATESQRGGRQIAPMLRLMTSDLVLDELDDFDLNDLPAITRLVHWAGLLGSRVLLSSATLPPALVQGLFEAYQNGRQQYERHHASTTDCTNAGASICCAWIDEFSQVAVDGPSPDQNRQKHAEFAQNRHAALTRAAASPSRLAALLPAPAITANKGPKRQYADQLSDVWSKHLLAAAIRLHRSHPCVDPVSGRRVSFGLIRLANINLGTSNPIIDIALSMFRSSIPEGCRVHICVHHSQHPQLTRSAIEQRLDKILRRHSAGPGAPDAVFQHAEVRDVLDAHPEQDHIFIVLGSPVTEVGRDHDYDWAVVEPSSMRSLIQLAGRVRRHRPGPAREPNILILDHNLRHFLRPGEPAFCHPGFESAEFQLTSHSLQALLRPEELGVIDARPRIVAQAQLQPRSRLVDLEHARLQATMLPARAPKATGGGRAAAAAASMPPPLNASTWWCTEPADATLTWVLQQKTPFRKEDGPPKVELALLPDRSTPPRFRFHRLADGQSVDPECQRIPDSAVTGERIQAWATAPYATALSTLAANLDIDPLSCAERFGSVSVRSSAAGWRYHPLLGISALC